jgi:hypothetical protein
MASTGDTETCTVLTMLAKAISAAAACAKMNLSARKKGKWRNEKGEKVRVEEMTQGR